MLVSGHGSQLWKTFQPSALQAINCLELMSESKALIHLTLQAIRWVTVIFHIFTFKSQGKRAFLIKGIVETKIDTH